MKILQINASYKPAYIYGGPTMSVSKLSEQLVNAGHTVNVFTTTANGDTELAATTDQPLLVDQVPVTYFKRLTKDHSHFSTGLLWAVWQKAKQFDVVHIHAWWNLVSVLSCLIALLRKVPVVVSPRGTLSNYSFHNKNAFYKNAIHNLLGKHLLQRSHIHVTSNNEYRAITQLVKPLSVSDIPNFIGLPAATNFRSEASTGVFKLLFFSRIEEKKGLDILLNALPSVTIPWHLTIAGTGASAYIDSLKKLAQDLNLTANISWIGFQSDDKFGILNDHDLMVLPSHDENFGNVVIESLSVGTAVLISDQVGLADHIEQERLGWICQTNAASVAKAINLIFTQRHQLDRIKSTAPQIINTNFSEQQLLKKYHNMYNTIINNG